MSTVLETPAPPATGADGDILVPVAGEPVVLHGVSWKLYRKLRRMPENYNIRMIYDRGVLEFMSPLRVHEEIAEFLGDLVVIWALERDIEIAACGKMTIRRRDLDRGFEPDNCYYIQHEAQMRGTKKVNFKSDPPPDLAIEVEVTRALGKKAEIYAAFRVPELWIWSGNALKVFELSGGGQYAPRESSICFPQLPIVKLEDSVRRLGSMGRTALLRSFRDWARADSPTGR